MLRQTPWPETRHKIYHNKKQHTFFFLTLKHDYYFIERMINWEHKQKLAYMITKILKNKPQKTTTPEHSYLKSTDKTFQEPWGIYFHARCNQSTQWGEKNWQKKKQQPKTKEYNASCPTTGHIRERITHHIRGEKKCEESWWNQALGKIRKCENIAFYFPFGNLYGIFIFWGSTPFMCF